MGAELQKTTCVKLKCLSAEMQYGRNCSAMQPAFAGPCRATHGFVPFFANTNTLAERYWNKKRRRPQFSPKCVTIVTHTKTTMQPLRMNYLSFVKN